MFDLTLERSACARRTRGVTLDHAARLYDWLAPAMTLGMERRLHRHVLDRLTMDRPLALLDVGCGTGSLTRLISRHMPAGSGRWIVGIDAAEAMVRVARGKSADSRGIRFEAAIAEDLPFAPSSFDRVVSTFFFHHVDRELKERCLAEIWRVLRPGGKAILLDVDIPYNRFGLLCAVAGYWLFRQSEIKENMDGVLREAIEASPFRGQWNIVSRHSGYVSLFELNKPRYAGKEKQA